MIVMAVKGGRMKRMSVSKEIVDARVVQSIAIVLPTRVDATSVNGRLDGKATVADSKGLFTTLSMDPNHQRRDVSGTPGRASESASGCFPTPR